MGAAGSRAKLYSGAACGGSVDNAIVRDGLFAVDAVHYLTRAVVGVGADG